MGNTTTREGRLRRIAAAGLTAVTVAALAACGSDAPDNTPDEANGQAWKPTRDVVMTVPFAAGGGNDVFARTIADAFEDLRPGLTITVENRVGASGAIGASEVFQKAGDPHRLLVSGTNIVTVPLERKVPYEVSDFTPIGQPIAQEVMAVAKSGTFKDLQAVVDRAKETSVTVAVGSKVDLGAIATRIIAAKTGGQFDFVIFNSGPEMTRAALTGDVDLAISAPENALEFVKEGSMDALAVFSPERLGEGALAEVPTAVEQGHDVVVEGVRGLWAAPDISEQETKYWTDLFREWTESPEFDQYIKKTNSVKQVNIGPDFADFLSRFTDSAEEALKGAGS